MLNKNTTNQENQKDRSKTACVNNLNIDRFEEQKR